MPLAAFIVLSSQKNATPVVGGPPITLAFSAEYLTWSDMYSPAGCEGAVAWDEVDAIVFRRGRTLLSPPEMAIVLKSGKEIVFDVAFPGTVWGRFRNGLTSLGATDLAKLLGEAPNTIEISGFYPGTFWIFIPVVLFVILVVTCWPILGIGIGLCIGFMAIAESLYRLIRRQRPEQYPRIIDGTKPKIE